MSSNTTTMAAERAARERAEADAARLREALRKSAEGWSNAIELGLIPSQHVATAEGLRDDARAALSASHPAPASQGVEGVLAEFERRTKAIPEGHENQGARGLNLRLAHDSFAGIARDRRSPAARRERGREAVSASNTNRIFPILTSYSVDPREARQKGRCFVIVGLPWEMIAPHEEQAQRNHSQTLKRLADRGGLSECEAVAVLEDRPWKRMDPDVAHRQLLDLIVAAATPTPPDGTPMQGDTNG